MFGLTGFKLGGVIAGLVAIIGALTWLVATVRDLDHLRTIVNGHQACLVDLRGGPRADPDLAQCEPEIAAAAVAQRNARACDAALSDATGKSDYTLRMTCSEPVKRLQASLAGLTADAADTALQLTRARDDLAGAAARGEARATTATTRTHHAQAAIAAAPIGADGLIRCAGDCLRALAGDAPGVAVRP